MNSEVRKVVEGELIDHPSADELRVRLIERGLSEDDVRGAMNEFADSLSNTGDKTLNRHRKLFSAKEVLDRVGYGFGTQQFVNILFYQTALLAGLGQFAFFFVGFFNGLKSLFSVTISAMLQEYQQLHQIPKRFIKWGGIIFGFSFLFMAFARAYVGIAPKVMLLLFGFSMLIGSIGVVSYGDLYNQLLQQTIRKERRGAFLGRIGSFGIVITAASLLAAGWLMEFIPTTGQLVNFLGKQVPLFGYLLAFEVAAFSFIISGYLLSFVKQKKLDLHYRFRDFFSEYRTRVKNYASVLSGNRIVILLFIASVLSGVAQALGNTFYGIFIYDRFRDMYLGGFLNVAVIFAVAVVVSVFGPWITTRVQRSIGYAPMLVFGTLLIAMMPFISAWNPNFFAIGLANAISVIGAAMVGFAQGLLARKLLREKERKMYFASLSMMITTPFVLLLPLGSLLASWYGLTFLFKSLVYTLVVTALVYVVLVALAEKKKL